MKEDFATYSFKRRGHAMPCRATWESARLVRRQKEPGKGMVRAHIVIPREEMGEAIEV